MEPKWDGDGWLDNLKEGECRRGVMGNERHYEGDSVKQGGKWRMEGQARTYLELG